MKKVFLLPHEVAFEPYLKAFQYKVLNSILFTNQKLCEIGYIQDDKCSLFKTDSESLYHIFFECRHTKQFWKEFQYYLYLWGWRRNQTLPVITAFSSKVKIKYETEKYISVKTNKMDKFNKKWALPLDSVLSVLRTYFSFFV